jgi:serine/threonine protein phosphatase PrpC
MSFTTEATTTPVDIQTPLSTDADQLGPQGSPSPGDQTNTPEVVSSTPSADQEEDASLAPTQILTPDQMMAYQSRRWQQELEQKAPQLDIAEMPTILMPPLEAVQIPPPATPSTTLVETAEATPAKAKEEETIEHLAPPEEEALNQNQQSQQTSPDEPRQQPQSEVTGGFPILVLGTLVSNRYEITQIVSEDASEHIYQVTDRQGYQRCWNCTAEENAEGDEFCITCGAELLNMSYILHEYPASRSSGESHVLQGTLLNTFVDQGHTYLVEQLQATQSAFPNGVHLLAATASDAGNVRRGEPNEDSTLALQLQRIHESRSSLIGIYLVADGMGGHANGQLASRTAISSIAERIIHELFLPPLSTEEAKPIDEASLFTLLQSAVEDANMAICQINQRNKTDMGATLTGFMITDDLAYILNIGDSRTYLLRDEKLYQLTSDHSLVGQLVAGGLIEPDDIYTHPQRSQIYRSLGDKQNVQVDIVKQLVHPGDILLSCSDGLWEMVRNAQITDILNNATDPQTVCTQLIEAANANGGDDNISVVTVFVR